MDSDLLPWALRPATRPNAGGGHVSRCSALGAALSAYRPVAAVVEKDGEAWSGRFRTAGISVIPEAETDGCSWAGVVLDDYSLQAKDVERWRQHVAGPVVQIVDHEEPLSGIDLAINATPGLGGNRLDKTPALLGASYAMLAAPYGERTTPLINSHIKRVVVGIGWIDPQGVTERVLAALGRVVDRSIRVDVMLSSASPNIAQVAAMVAVHPAWRLRRDVGEPWTLLDGADIAISAAGQGLLERLAFGIPTLAFAIADNQEPALTGVAAAGAAQSLGRLPELSEDRIAAAFTVLAGDAALRARLAAAAQRLVDGQGSSRVARHLAGMCDTRNDVGSVNRVSP